MKYSLTIFKNTFDNQTHRGMILDSWDGVEKLLRDLYKQEGKKGGRNSSVLISPARYFPDSTRSNKNVDLWGGWACLDVDDYVVHPHPTRSPVECLTIQLAEAFGRFHYVCYNTASSREEKPKFRLVFPLTRQVASKELPHFWFAMNKQFDGLGDKQTKDLSRMYYVPAQYPDAYSFIFTNEGVHLDPDMLMDKYSFIETSGKTFMERLPLELQQAVMQHRKDALEATDITWSGYRDCPFFPKRMGVEYQTISETGWYSKMYAIMIATAGNAYKRGYPISSIQIAQMCSELDLETGNWYKNRPLDKEADRALEYIYRNG
jgi:hypothetical protein|tara:strand:+ start:800 stop:1756 length:957 start_codon:yes stop_codon:yes gene_type:complete